MRTCVPDIFKRHGPQVWHEKAKHQILERTGREILPIEPILQPAPGLNDGFPIQTPGCKFHVRSNERDFRTGFGSEWIVVYRKNNPRHQAEIHDLPKALPRVKHEFCELRVSQYNLRLRNFLRLRRGTSDLDRRICSKVEVLRNISTVLDGRRSIRLPALK